jgi:hypothetical protein
MPPLSHQFSAFACHAGQQVGRRVRTMLSTGVELTAAAYRGGIAGRKGFIERVIE